MCVIACGFIAATNAFAQGKKDGITYTNVTPTKCRSMCIARGWTPDDCKSWCRPGCRQGKTTGEHFCVVGK